MTKKKTSTTDAIAILHREFLAGDSAMRALVQEARMESDIARQIRQLREKAGLTQRQLAALVKTTPSVISRLESADYQGHSLAMLHRIALALGRQLKIEFIASRRSA
jgi:ribosome-binding protein aMBF1 (putative translation factor)